MPHSVRCEIGLGSKILERCLRGGNKALENMQVKIRQSIKPALPQD